MDQYYWKIADIQRNAKKSAGQGGRAGERIIKKGGKLIPY
jgi:hypothetical protein